MYEWIWVPTETDLFPQTYYPTQVLKSQLGKVTWPYKDGQGRCFATGRGWGVVIMVTHLMLFLAAALTWALVTQAAFWSCAEFPGDVITELWASGPVELKGHTDELV